MNRLDMNRVTAQLAARIGSLPSVVITESRLIEEDLARIICQFSPGNKEPKLNAQALAAKLDGRATAVEGSFRVLAREAGRITVVGHVVPNRITKELTTEVKAKMTVISTNVLMDAADESLWDVTKTPSGQVYISRQEHEDLSELMATASVEKFGVPKFSTIATAIETEDEYVAFATASGDVRYGFITEATKTGLNVLCRDNQEVIEIDADQIIESVSNVDRGDIIAKVRNSVEATNGLDAGKMIDFYKKVYNYDPEYLALVEQQIREHAVL